MAAIAHVMQYCEDTIIAGRKLEQLMWSGTVTGDHHVVTLVRDLITGKHYYGFNKRLRDQLRPLAEYIPDQLQRRIPGRQVQELNILQIYFEKERREPIFIRRSPSACAEYDAYNKFYASRPGALPNESRAVSVMHCNDEYIAVKRCANCLMYAEAMGDVPTDSIHGLRIPLHGSTGYIHLVESIMRTNFKNAFGNPFQASREYSPGRVLGNSVRISRNYAAYTPGRVAGNSARTSREYAAYTPGRVPGNSARTSRDYAAYTQNRDSGNSVRTSRDYAAYTPGRVAGNSARTSREYAVYTPGRVPESSVGTSREKENKIACCVIL